MEKYEEIFERMKAKYIEESGSEIDSAGDIGIRLRVLAGEIYNMQTNLEWLKRQMFPSTADGEFLDRFARMRGLERYPARKAVGTLRFSLNEVKSTSVAIPAGTVVSTEADRPVRIYTTEDSEIPPNTYYVLVNAEAEEAGYRGNINGNTAVIPVNVPSDIDSVTNPGVFHDGCDEENDLALRERIQQSYVNRPNGMNAQYYIDLATSVDGVYKAGVVPKLRGLGTIDVYVSGYDYYLSDEKLAEVNALINTQRELNVDVRVGRANGRLVDLKVTVMARAGYENSEIKEKCEDAFVNYLNSLPVGGKLYLSALGKHLLETGCIENYEFGPTMDNETVPGSMFFVAGDVNIEVV